MYTDGRNNYLIFGNNADVIKYIITYYEKWRYQPAELVKNLRNETIEDKCWSIFNYLLENVRYKEDTAGYQFIKSPARLLADGEGDCKSMTIFITSCLHCLGIPHTIRFVNFDGGKQYTHVYPIAHDTNGRSIILDAVERDEENMPVFDYARPYKAKKDIYYNK